MAADGITDRMMKIDIKTLKGLETFNNLIQAQNIAMKDHIDLRERGVVNSLSSISGPGFGQYQQTPITSILPTVQNNIWQFITLDWMTLEFAYKTHGLIQALCDMPVLDALRGGLEIQSKELSPEDHDLLKQTLKAKNVLRVVGQGCVWKRLLGGAGVIIQVDRPMIEPLDLKRLAKSQLIKFRACHRWEILSPWRIAPVYTYYGTDIDASKVLTMAGKEAPNPLGWMLQGWGMSELEHCLEDFNTYLRVKNVIYALLDEAKVDVYKFKDFAKQIISSEAENKTNKRMQVMNAAKNYNSALLLDSEDDYLQKQVTFSGLAEIYREARIEMASSLRIPMSKLFGIPSTGFSSGEDDRENYHEMIESEIREPLRPDILKILQILCEMLFGYVPDDLDFEYMPLKLLSAKEQEEVDTSKFNRAMQFYDRGLITPEELGSMLAKDKLIDVDVELMDNPEIPGMEEGAEEEETKEGE